MNSIKGLSSNAGGLGFLAAGALVAGGWASVIGLCAAIAIKQSFSKSVTNNKRSATAV
jgi:hypothetical protein